MSFVRSFLIRKRIVVSLAGSCLALACAPMPTARAPQSPALVGSAIPDPPLRDLRTGQPLSLPALNQHGLIVDIWASWCEPCKEELPLLDDLAARLGKTGLTVVAVSIDEDGNNALEFLRQKKEWTLRLAHDPQGLLPRALQPSKMPSTYVVSPGGQIRKILDGFDRGELGRLERELTQQARP